MRLSLHYAFPFERETIVVMAVLPVLLVACGPTTTVGSRQETETPIDTPSDSSSHDPIAIDEQQDDSNPRPVSASDVSDWPSDWLRSNPDIELMSVTWSGDVNEDTGPLGRVRRVRLQRQAETQLCVEWSPYSNPNPCYGKTLSSPTVWCWTHPYKLSQVTGGAVRPLEEGGCEGFVARLGFISDRDGSPRIEAWDVKLPAAQKRLVKSVPTKIDEPSPLPYWAYEKLGPYGRHDSLSTSINNWTPSKGNEWQTISMDATPSWAQQLSKNSELRVRVVSYGPGLPAVQIDKAPLDSTLAVRHSGQWHLYRDGVGLIWSFLSGAEAITGRSTSIQAWADSEGHGSEGQTDASWALFEAENGELRQIARLVRGGMMWFADFSERGRSETRTRVLHEVEPLSSDCVRLKRVLADTIRVEYRPPRPPRAKRLGKIKRSDIPAGWNVEGTWRLELEGDGFVKGDCSAKVASDGEMPR